MAMLRHVRPVCRSGTTLIELILAIAIASLVITLVFSLYHTVSATLGGQEERRRGADAATDAVRQIARDLACAFALKFDETCKFTLQKDGHGTSVSQLSFCSAVMPEGETDLRWLELRRIAYRLDVKTSMLLRENQPLAGPGAFVSSRTNALEKEVESFHVSVHNGLEWKDEWADASCPRAARIEVTTRRGSGVKTFQTEVLIPAGNSISSTITRIRR